MKLRLPRFITVNWLLVAVITLSVLSMLGFWCDCGPPSDYGG